MLDTIVTHSGEPNEIALDCWQVSPATFIRDFGPWKKGETVATFCLDLLIGTATSYGDDGCSITNSCKVGLVPLALVT